MGRRYWMGELAGLVLLFCSGFALPLGSAHAQRESLLHAGDVLQIRCLSCPQFNQTLTVSSAGDLILAAQRNLDLSGKTVENVRHLILETAPETVHAADLVFAVNPTKRYTLHPGDVVELIYRLSPEFNQTVTLEPDGDVSLNVGGDVKLSGLTLEEARGAIISAASARLNDPELNLVLKDFQKPFVVVGGEVENPGKIELRDDMTAMQAILLAGGPKQTAKATQIVLYRPINGVIGEVHVLKLGMIPDAKHLEQDMVLRPGDMLLVPANKVETFSRYMRAANFGTYVNPTAF